MRDFTTSLDIKNPIGALHEFMFVNNILADISRNFLARMMEGPDIQQARFNTPEDTFTFLF